MVFDPHEIESTATLSCVFAQLGSYRRYDVQEFFEINSTINKNSWDYSVLLIIYSIIRRILTKVLKIMQVNNFLNIFVTKHLYSSPSVITIFSR